MRWNSDESTERRGYHHGNLREALIEAALALIGAKGAAGFTIAEAARRAGVSPGAPYRHFRDGDALLAEVAARGFAMLGAALAGAWNHGRPEPLRAFEAMGRAYLTFARARPEHYAAMFDTRLANADHPGLATARDNAFAVLREAAEQLVAGLDPRPPGLMVALHVWALAHGIASLFGRADAGKRPLPMSAEDLLEAGILLYLQGVGLGGGRAGR
jgi:AcrR family transcriptional regulator